MKPLHAPLPPYIGITDFMTRRETLAMLSYFEAFTVGTIPHKLMIGVMMSYKTLNGIPTKWSAAFPKNDTVKNIFVRHPVALNTLHYADYTNTDVAVSLAKAMYLGGRELDALQLDMVWPSPREIEIAFRNGGKQVAVILQVGAKAMENAKHKVSVVVSRLMDYSGLVDGVLLDRSMGRGKPMDPTVLLPYVNAITTHLPDLRIAVAGGLGPSTVHLAKPLILKFPDISIDAQGKLRPSGDALDPIDWSLAEEYLQNAVVLFQRSRFATAH